MLPATSHNKLARGSNHHIRAADGESNRKTRQTLCSEEVRVGLGKKKVCFCRHSADVMAIWHSWLKWTMEHYKESVWRRRGREGGREDTPCVPGICLIMNDCTLLRVLLLSEEVSQLDSKWPHWRDRIFKTMQFLSTFVTDLSHYIYSVFPLHAPHVCDVGKTHVHWWASFILWWRQPQGAEAVWSSQVTFC